MSERLRGGRGGAAFLAPGTYRWGELRAHAEAVLGETGVDNPLTEARWMVERAAGEEPPRDDDLAPARAVGHVVDMLEQRVAGNPLQHVLGRWAFRRLELVVDHRALIPRVETEIVADAALEEAVRHGAARGPTTDQVHETDVVVADLGTGSGVLALALVDELPTVEVWATDISGDALAVARANLASVGLAAARVRLAHGSWFEALPGELRGGVHVIVSNPPYVSESEHAQLPPEVKDHEPAEALVSGPTGLEAIREIAEGAPEWLAPGGSLVLELAPHRADDARAAVAEAGFEDVEVRPDLVGRERVLVARLGRR